MVSSTIEARGLIRFEIGLTGNGTLHLRVKYCTVFTTVLNSKLARSTKFELIKREVKRQLVDRRSLGL